MSCSHARFWDCHTHTCCLASSPLQPCAGFFPSPPFPSLLNFPSLPFPPLTNTLCCPGKHGAVISLTPERAHLLIQNRAAFDQLQTTSLHMQPVLVVWMLLKSEQAVVQRAMPARIRGSQQQQLAPKPQGPWMIYWGRSLICCLKSMTYLADDALSTVVKQLGSQDSAYRVAYIRWQCW